MQDNDPTPNSIFKKPPSNQSIPLKSIFGRIFKDISNIPQSCDRPQSGGFGSQAVQMPRISSPRFGKLSQTPYVAATIMGYCKSKRNIYFYKNILLSHLIREVSFSFFLMYIS